MNLEGFWNWAGPCLRGGLAALLCAAFSAVSAPVYAAKYVDAIGPLRVTNPEHEDWQNHPMWEDARAQVKKAKADGYTAISIDVWWGIVMKKGPKTFSWDYYDRLFNIVWEEGLLVAPILSTHQCGTNIGDDVYIPQPQWFLEKLQPTADRPDLAYISEAGHRSEEDVSDFGLAFVIEDKQRFFQEFANHYSAHAEKMTKVIVGMGPSGERLRPSYHIHDRRAHVWQAKYPNRGTLQASAPIAQDSLRRYLRNRYRTIKALNDDWGLVDGSRYRSFNDISMLTTTREVDRFFETNQQYTKRGQAFFGWYHQTLIDAGLMYKNAAEQVFRAEGSAWSKVPLAMKYPGVHWGWTHRIPQLTAGLISTEGANPDPSSKPLLEQQPADWKVENGNGYHKLFSELALADGVTGQWEVIFTCGELADCPMECFTHGTTENCGCKVFGQPGLSGAHTLVRGIGHLGDKLGLRIILENALAGSLHDGRALSILEGHLRAFRSFKGVSLLRMEDAVKSEHAPGFVKRVLDIQHPEETCAERLAQAAFAGVL